MNKPNGSVINFFILVAILFLFTGIISAENLTRNETIILNETVILDNGTVGEEAICDEQLQILLEEYSLLLEDYREGSNCGIAFSMVKDLNRILSEERDNCREEIGKIKVYRGGFYILLGVLGITAIIIFFSAIKKRK